MARPSHPAVAGIALLVAACTGAAPTQPVGNFTDQMAWQEGEPTPDGCAVVSADEVSAASGYAIVESAPMMSGEPGCAYFDADGLVLSTRFHPRATTGQANFDAEMERGDAVEISGIGDQAIWIERAWQLWAWSGDTLVMVGIGRIGETPERLELAKKLGPLVVDRFD
jgi:hypothetical protein